VASPLDEVNAVAVQARRTGLILLALALIFAAVVVSRLVRLAAEPISELTRAAQAMADGRLGVNIPEASGELSMLSDALENLRDQMRHRLEDLEAEQRNLRAVLDGLSEAVFLLHGDRIRFANQAADELFKRPVTGWQNRAFDNAGLPASVHGGVMEVLGTDSSRAFECGPDPQGRYLRVAVIHLNPAEGSPRTLVTVGDITERMSIDAVRRDFVANASHELKTPASAIQLLAESAVDAASHGDNDQAVGFARQIATESSRLSNLVRDLLDLSRLEAAVDTEGTTDMRAAVENTLLGHRNAASESGLETSFDDEAAGIDAYVRADATDVAVALDNLLDNAIKYTESGSVTVSLCVDDDTVTVSIRDTGPGIPPEDLPRIFERFYRVDRARSRESGGTGLGLSLVRHVVERNAGSIDVTSEPGVGSTFSVTLPRATRES
jgi:signal transduction histidine kinase/HAMP domain-containing protein